MILYFAAYSIYKPHLAGKHCLTCDLHQYSSSSTSNTSKLEQRIGLCSRQTNPVFTEEVQQGQIKGKTKACAFTPEVCDLFTGKLQRLKNKTPKEESVDMTREAADK